MTREEARKILRRIGHASSVELEKALDLARDSSRRSRRNGTLWGSGIGAIAGALTGDSPASRIWRALAGLAGGGAIGYGTGALFGSGSRAQIYDAVKKRRDKQISDVLGKMDDDDSYQLQRELAKTRTGIQTNGTEYGIYLGGKGSYSENDRLPIRRDENGKPVLSILFSGINSSVINGKGHAHSPVAERFYNRNRDKFSDVQANSVFDDPVVSDAYMDKIVSKIMANRAKDGKYPKIRLVGYSAGGRGIVNFLRKIRERDPQFRADEIIGIDPYQFPWESVPDSLKDPLNPVANKIVYSRLADNYTGSSKKGLGRLKDVFDNTFVSVLGKKLNGLAANTVIENPVSGVAHTDADAMYGSALEVLSNLNKKRKNKE